jgi:uncharacterized protein
MNCPKCNAPLQMSQRQGVEIDHCPQCRGVWLDRGELDKIIERSSMLMPQREIRETYHHDDNHHDEEHSGHGHDKHHYKRKRGFLSELFD